jgi:membrane-bound lytic murein transglycosylase
MDNTHRWPAGAVVAVAVLAVASAGGWYDTMMQVQARSAASHAADVQRRGLESRVAAVEQDLSHANAEAQAFAAQAKAARTELASARQRATALASQLAEAQSREKNALATADREIGILKAARAGHRSSHRGESRGAATT